MSHISEQVATGDEVAGVVSMLEDALIGTPRGLCIIALISMSLVLQNPDITPDDLQIGVKEVSRYICLLLDQTEVPTDPNHRKLMN